MNGGNEFINKIISKVLSAANTAALGTIESYSEGRANITVYPEKELIENVPVCFPQSGDYYMHFPLDKGELVLVIFAQHEIEGPLFGEDVTSNRTKDINDAIAFPGISREGKFPADAAADAFTIGSIKGGAKIVMSGDKVEINAPGGVTITGRENTGSW